MPRLLNKNKEKVLVSHLKTSRTLRQRVQGLIGKAPLKETEALWIPSCPSVHTFFMSQPIDVVFTDRSFQVLSLYERVSSGRILWGGWKSWNVFEMKSGQIEKLSIKKGDVFYVES